ncbi:class A beta-lactamase [Asaia sp. BMEF1]|uniref:class A beta-lactamase n=1 Tax=Asaia sp. BMEF1 TaxID=3155932 RepID=UPI003F672BA0
MRPAPDMKMARRSFLASLPLIGITTRSAFAAETASGSIQSEQHDALAEIARRFEKDSGGRIGAHLFCPETGTALSWRGEERFLMCSSFKASLVACVLGRCDRDEDDLTHRLAFIDSDFKAGWAPVARQNRDAGSLSLAALCAGAVTMSDNVCANMLLRHIGGPAALTRFWRDSGDDVTRLDAFEPELNRPSANPQANTTSPVAMARTLHRLIHGTLLHPHSAALLRGWMISCATGTHRLRAGLPAHWIAGDKTGNNGKDISADIAFAAPEGQPGKSVIMTAYTSGGTPDETRFRRVFHDIGALAPQLVG